MFIPIEFQKAFQKTQQNALAITATYHENPPLLHSRFGGTPYWPAGAEAPVDSTGTPLALLAQLNFAEMPAHDCLPAQGILQLFLPKSADDYGAALGEVGAMGQLVSRFWEAPSEAQAAPWPSEAADSEDLFPVFGAHVLQFHMRPDYAGIETIECAQALNANPFEVLEDIALNEKEETLFYEAIVGYAAADGHKLLGYPYFIQSEPREDDTYRLLLQIDTDLAGDNDIMWGDNGVGQVYIRETDLQARCFDRLWFYWDC